MRFGIVKLILLAGIVLAAVGGWAQDDIPTKGTGKRGEIHYGETVTGTITGSTDNITPWQFVGHNGANRMQGDFDVWYFDVPKETNSVITATATSGDLIPTLLVITEPDQYIRYVNVNAEDDNVDGDRNAGVCLRSTASDERRAVLIYRQTAGQTGSYRLTLETAANKAELSGGSATAVCQVGSFVVTRGNYWVNIRSNPGLQFSVKTAMQPQQPYVWYSESGDWTHILFWAGDRVDDGYVSTRLIRVTGSLSGTTEK